MQCRLVAFQLKLAEQRGVRVRLRLEPEILANSLEAPLHLRTIGASPKDAAQVLGRARAARKQELEQLLGCEVRTRLRIARGTAVCAARKAVKKDRTVVYRVFFEQPRHAEYLTHLGTPITRFKHHAHVV
jgi:hypothetical protein